MIMIFFVYFVMCKNEGFTIKKIHKDKVREYLFINLQLHYSMNKINVSECLKVINMMPDKQTKLLKVHYTFKYYIDRKIKKMVYIFYFYSYSSCHQHCKSRDCFHERRSNSAIKIPTIHCTCNHSPYYVLLFQSLKY